MAQILIRNLDETTIERLKLRATQSGRSLQAEVKMILDQAAHVDLQTARLTAARIRDKLKGRPTTDSVDLLREERYGFADIVAATEAGVDLAPANIDLAAAEIELSSEPGRESTLFIIPSGYIVK